MKKPRVVLDACVLIPQYLRDVLLSVAWADLYHLYWSEHLLTEIKRNLIKQYQLTPSKASKLILTMNKAFSGAMVEVPLELINLMSNDLKDRHVLATAIVAKAEIIVTNNLADFQPSSLESWEITAQSPDVFLTNLFNNYPEEIVQIIQKQSSKYQNPKKSVLELLDFLGQKASLSTFSSCVKSVLDRELS
ncbi:MAG: PIN domain-containing protein [Gloeocapsa sp. DLM2.Bin57]|nr:MAG: PIN domain-containing protein [Gloeocapsa sp. DLM2.Bin57]